MELTRKVRLLLLLTLTFFPPSASFAQKRLSVEEQKKLAIQGRDFLLVRDYERAETFLKKIVSDHPDELLGYFGMMTLCQVRNLDNFDFRFDEKYLPWEEKGRKMALKIVRDADASPWDLLIAGGTLGVSGFYRAHNTKWFAGLWDGSTGVHAMERGFRKDPTLVEALLGSGLFDYWSSYFTRKLRFLPFFPDKRKEGRAKITRAMKEPHFSSVLAEISLAFIDLQEKRFEEVLKTTDRLLKLYPKNTILRMLRGEVLLRKKKYPESIQEFEKMLEIDPTITKSYLFIGMAYAKAGKNEEKAKEYLKKYLILEPKSPYHWRKPAIQRLRKLEKKR